MFRYLPALFLLSIAVVVSTTASGHWNRLDNVDYDDGNCVSKDFSCPKERLAVTDHLAGRFSSGERWLRENADIVERHIDTVRQLSVELLLAESPDSIDKLKYRIHLEKQKLRQAAEPVLKVFQEVSVKMAQNESDPEYMRYYRFCFNLGHENYMRHYHVCGMQKLGDKFYKMSVKTNGEKYHAQAMYYHDFLGKFRNYDKYIASRLAPFRDFNDRLMGISYKSALGSATFWRYQLVEPFFWYANSVGRYLQVAENIGIKKADLLSTKSRKARIALEIRQAKTHRLGHKELLEGVDLRIHELKKKIASSRIERLRTLERLGSLYDTIKPKSALAFLSSESVQYDQSKFLNVAEKPFKTPSSASFVQVTASRRLLYKANGFWRKNRQDFPNLLGAFSTSKGYVGSFLGYDDIPQNDAPVGALLARFSGGATLEVGADGPVPLPAELLGQSYGLMVNDFQPGLSRSDCPNPLSSDKRCFVLEGGPVTFTANYFGETGEEFRKVLTYLKANLEGIVNDSVNTADPFNRVRDKVLVGIQEYTDDIFPYLPIINHALSAKLIEKKTTDFERALQSMYDDRNLIQSHAMSVKQNIAELEEVLEGVADDAARSQAVVNSFYERKFILERTLLYASMARFSEVLGHYIDSLIYRNPTDRTSFKKRAVSQAVLTKLHRALGRLKSREGLSKGTRTEIRTLLCSPFAGVAASAKALCESFNAAVTNEDVAKAMTKFFSKSPDKEVYHPQDDGEGVLVHCQLHLGARSGRGKSYLMKQFGVDFVERLFVDGNRRSEFYVDTNFSSPRFNLNKACSFVASNLRRQCVKNPESAREFLREIEGYYEFQFQTFNGFLDPKSNNLECRGSDGPWQGEANLLMLGAAVEWSSREAQELFRTTSSRVVLQKSASSWFDVYFADGKHKTYYSILGDLSSSYSRMIHSSVRLMETSLVKGDDQGKATCVAYHSTSCALKLLGSSLEKPTEDYPYKFRSTFLNSRDQSDWILLVPIFKGEGRIAYNRLMIEQLRDLRIHFYFRPI